MIYLELFWGFLKVGCFAFGGGYGAIPLIREVVTAYGWLDDEALSYMIAVSESTPGPAVWSPRLPWCSPLSSSRFSSPLC